MLGPIARRSARTLGINAVAARTGTAVSATSSRSEASDLTNAGNLTPSQPATTGIFPVLDGGIVLDSVHSASTINLRDAMTAYKARTVPELLRAIAIFQTCKFTWIVKNAETLLAASAAAISQRLTDVVVKNTFFAQFCAGEDPDEVKPLMARLKASGVGSILDYAAEADLKSTEDHSSEGVYPPQIEEHCNGNMRKYLQAIVLASATEGDGTVAIKLTSLGNPKLLQRLSDNTDSFLSTEEMELIRSLEQRLDRLAAAAANANVRLLVDAEHSYFQRAIDYLAVNAMKNHNQTKPVVFNTYQCYLKDSHDKLWGHVAEANVEGYKFGAKLVRGAYMKMERERAAEMGYPSPIHDTIEDTHHNFDECVDLMLHQIKNGTAHVVIASHNEQSVIKAMTRMEELGLPPVHEGVMFGQLQGMCDFLTYSLSAKGYHAYKYLPYGPLHEVMPYLIRRAQENSDVLGTTDIEKVLMLEELKRRFKDSRGFAAAS